MSQPVTPPAGPTGLSPMKPADLRAMARVLTRSFFHDPFYQFVFRNEKQRARKLAWLLRCFLRYGLLYGQVTALEGLRGAAIWLGPDHPIYDFSKLLWLGVYQSIFRLDTTDFIRINSINRRFERWHEQEEPRHYYLMVIGIEPGHQRQGLGSALLRPLLQQADEQKLPCYLETMREDNLAFYRKFGFAVVHDGRAGNGAPFWALRRKALPAGFSPG